jgi:ribosomal protein L2
MEDAPWIRAKVDGLLGKWHMPAGTLRGGVLTACDHPFSAGEALEERAVEAVPANERCHVCQGLYAARESVRP